MPPKKPSDDRARRIAEGNVAAARLRGRQQYLQERFNQHDERAKTLPYKRAAVIALLILTNILIGVFAPWYIMLPVLLVATFVASWALCMLRSRPLELVESHHHDATNVAGLSPFAHLNSNRLEPAPVPYNGMHGSGGVFVDVSSVQDAREAARQALLSEREELARLQAAH